MIALGGRATSIHPIRVYVHGHVHRLGFLKGEGVVAAAPIVSVVGQFYRSGYSSVG